MKIKNKITLGRIFIAIGLLVTIFPAITKYFPIPMSDFVRGLVPGLGLALEITGIFLLRKERKSRCGSIFWNTHLWFK